MEVLVAKLKRTKTNRKLLAAHAFTVAVATCHLVIGLGHAVRVCSPENRGTAAAIRASAVALLRRLSGDGKVMGGCGGEWRRRWWCSTAAGRRRTAVVTK